MAPSTRKTVLHFEAVAGKLTDEYVDPIKEAALAAIYQEADLTDYLLSTRLNSFNANLHSYLRFGRSHYERGLPEGTHSYGHVPADIVEQALEDELSAAVVVDGATIEEPVLDYFALDHLQGAYPGSWDPVKRSFLINKDTYFYTGVALDPRDSSKMRMGFYRGRLYQMPGTGELVRVYGTITIDAPPIKPHYHVRYHKKNEPADKVRYWTYDPTTGVHPTLDSWFNEHPFQSEFYPIVPIRVDTKWINEDDTTKERYHYESCKDILKKVNIDIDDLIVGVGKKENGEDDVDDLDQINDVFFQFAIDIYTEEEKSIEYLFGTFKHLDYQSVTTKVDYNRSFDAMNESDAVADIPTPNFFTVKEDDFESTIRWNFTEITQETGILENEFEKEIVIKPAFTKSFEINQDPNDWYDGDQTYTVTTTIEQSEVLLKRRTGANTFEQVKVAGLEHWHIVEGHNKKRRVDKVLDADYIGSDKEEFKVGKSAFFIPLSWMMMDELGISGRAPVAYDSMMITINAVNKQDLEWYQTGIFAAILKVVMIAISIWIFVATGGMASYISATLWQLALMMFSGFAFNFVVQLLIEHLGDIGLLIALVLAVAMAWTGAGIGSGLKGLPFAQQLLGATNSVAGVLNKYVEVGMENLQQEMTEFIQSAEEIAEEDQKARDYLDSNSHMNPLYITGFLDTMPPEETPDIYFRRTIHEKNIGVLTLDAIHDYHSDALKLPEPDFLDTEYSFA